MGKTEVGCRPLKYREIPSTVDVKMRAFRDNPFINYIFQPPPDAREPRVGKLCTFFYIECVYYVSQREAIAIDGGDGYITYGSASNALSPLRKMFRRMLQAVVFCFLVLIFMLAGTKEQRQRLKEARLKSHAAKDGAIGGQRDDMFAIDTLAVSPDKQGMGYGSALLQAVTSRADAQARRSYLSTRPETRAFYEKFGFAVVASYTVGENNPIWTKSPVQQVIMVREPKSPKDARREKLSFK